ncbi:hypothetical protein PQX77_013719, partial [Marasmius sp. AFHP31]
MGKRTGNPRGRQSWGRGKRLEVLEKHKDLFLKNSTSYYNKVIEEFLDRWGTLDVEVDPDTVDPATFVLVDTNTIEDLTKRNEEIKRQIKGLSTPRPRRAQPDKYYQNKYWHSKLSAEFEQKRNETASETGETSAKVSVDNRNRFAKEKWDGETEEEKAKIMEEIEAKYQEELEEYKRCCDWSGTALSYH